MTIYQPETLRALLAASNADLGEGLGSDELDDVESRFGFHFGPDHREFLASVFPVGRGWPDWRHGSESELRHQLDWPVDSLMFHVDHDGFWPSSWGERPADPTAALALGRRNLSGAPKLLPIYLHRFLPAAPCAPRSPVFSVYGVDTVYYGADLEDYLHCEFVDSVVSPPERKPSRVPFWSELAENRLDDL